MHTLSLFITFFCLLSCGFSAYTLVDNFSGNNFFNNFQFFTAADPTHGYVFYASASQASDWGYTSVTNNVVYIRSDYTSVSSGAGRGSVRITSNKSYNGGLFLFDVIHMPFGCGTWPAIWTVGPNWPNSGEIDVIEGVNNVNHNSMTLHSKSGCTMPTNSLQTGSQATTNCDSNVNGNQGCGVTDNRATSYGAGFNSNGGGVHALLWTSSSIQIWFFPRNAIPGDISSGNPNPSGWGTPAANFPFGSNCPSSFFQNHQIVLDNTFCGDWAGAVFSSMGCGGNCQSFVQNNPSSFSESYWAINSFKVYQPTSSPSTSTSSSSSTTGQSTPGSPPASGYLQSKSTGKYVTLDGNTNLVATATSTSSATLFTFTPNQYGYTIKAAQFVCADNAGASPLVANRPTADTWESFVFVQDGSYWEIKSYINNNYVAVQGNSQLQATQPTGGSIPDSARFSIV